MELFGLLIILHLIRWKVLEPWLWTRDLKQFQTRREQVPRFKDVWDESRYLATLQPQARRHYYREKWIGHPIYCGTTKAKRAALRRFLAEPDRIKKQLQEHDAVAPLFTWR